MAYADAHYTETVMSADQVVVRDGDAVGALPLVSPPWSVTASGDYQLKFASDVLATLHAQDVFHSRNPGPFTSENPAAIAYAPLRRPNPSTNQLNLSAMASWSNVELSVFVNNVLDSQPTLQRRNYLARDTLTYATTVRPRTVGVSANWRL